MPAAKLRKRRSSSLSTTGDRSPEHHVSTEESETTDRVHLAPDLPQTAGLGPLWLLAGVLAVLAAALVGICIGPVRTAPGKVLLDALDGLPFISLDSGLTELQSNIIWKIRAPRVALGLLVGAMLAGSGAAYQGVFRNPLADPYLLGIAAGAGLGATLAIVFQFGDGQGLVDGVPIAAFIGSLGAVAMAALLSSRPGRATSTTTLILAGVAVAAFLTAVQTYVQQRHQESLRQVYAWILGRLSTSGWSEVLFLLPYAAVCLTVLVFFVGALDVLAVGDDEAASLGVSPTRIRWTVLVFASLATAAAVSVSGLIGFVGLIVPHAVRTVAGVSNRRVLPLSILFGGAFLALADVAARTIDSPAELPIGVITAFIGAPFFLMILRTQETS